MHAIRIRRRGWRTCSVRRGLTSGPASGVHSSSEAPSTSSGSSAEYSSSSDTSLVFFMLPLREMFVAFIIHLLQPRGHAGHEAALEAHDEGRARPLDTANNMALGRARTNSPDWRNGLEMAPPPALSGRARENDPWARERGARDAIRSRGICDISRCIIYLSAARDRYNLHEPATIATRFVCIINCVEIWGYIEVAGRACLVQIRYKRYTISN